MNVLVIGNGAREHAAVRKFAESSRLGRLYCAPGNAGTEALAESRAINLKDHDAVIAVCRELEIGLVFIGPEDPLADGLSDSLSEAGIPAFGPGRDAARLESSKSFAREKSDRWGIPSARTTRFMRGETARFLSFAENLPYRVVLKKSGLAAGKGVLESEDPEELKGFGLSVLRDDDLLAEEFLSGWEVSVFALCDGKTWVTLPPCSDHKKAGKGDSGPNTGGMGAICPVPGADAGTMGEIERTIVAPALQGMMRDGLGYRGVLFLGVMMTASGPKLLEFNVRFGDPETQSLFALWDDDLIDVCERVTSGKLSGFAPDFSRKAACGFVVAAPGYPGAYPVNIAVGALPAEEPGTAVFHASTKRDPGGVVRTGGGRCFTAVAKADTLEQARIKARNLAAGIKFEGSWFRPDIGAKFLRTENEG